LRSHFDLATFDLRLCDFRPLCTSTSRLFKPTATFLDLSSLLEGLGDPILAPQPLSTVLLTSHRSDWVFFPSRRTVGTSPGETLRNVTGWRWKSWQPGDAVRRHAEDGTMVGGGAGDRSGGVRHVLGRKTHWKAEDTSGGGRCIGRRKTRRKQKQSLRQKGVA